MKTIIGCSLAFVAVTGLVVYGCNKIGDGMCGNDVVQNVVSPDGTVKAVVFERDCGATTGFSTQISVVGATEGLPNAVGNVFIGDGNSVATGPKGTMPVRVTWTSARQLQIEYPAQATVYQSSSRVPIGLGWFRNKLIHIHFSAVSSPSTR